MQYDSDCKQDFVVRYWRLLEIIDVSDPLNPGTPLHIDIQGYARDVFISGDYAYVAAWYSRLAIVNVSDIFNETAKYNLNQKIILVGLVTSMIFATLMVFLISFSLSKLNFIDTE